MKRVAVTGIGVVTPLGNTPDEFRQGLLTGRSGVTGITHFDPLTLPSKIAGQCRLPVYRFKDRKIDFAEHAMRSGIAYANENGTPLENYYPAVDRGLSMGIGLELFNMSDLVACADPSVPDPATRAANDIEFLQTPGDLCVREVSRVMALGQPAAIHISACAAGTDAIGDAFLRIARGQARLMLAGGTDSMINPLGLGGFCKLNALSTRNHEPQKASRPFDRSRDGFVLGEGAAILILENLDDARRRGAKVLAEILGYGNSFDAHSISEPDPQGRGAALAMQKALSMACLTPTDITYVNAHGTATPKNDPAETRAIRAVFGAHAARLAVSSTKSMIGHLISAAGAVEAAAAIFCANAGMVHPTTNLDNPDPECDLDYVAHTARKCAGEHFISNSFAFGGMNACVAFRIGGA